MAVRRERGIATTICSLAPVPQMSELPCQKVDTTTLDPKTPLQLSLSRVIALAIAFMLSQSRAHTAVSVLRLAHPRWRSAVNGRSTPPPLNTFRLAPFVADTRESARASITRSRW
eukprot:6182009-Pleurochrysis_carterae.AAC.2